MLRTEHSSLEVLDSSLITNVAGKSKEKQRVFLHRVPIGLQSSEDTDSATQMELVGTAFELGSQIWKREPFFVHFVPIQLEG